MPARRAGSRYCCPGCETVYLLLKDRGLDRYYEIRGKDRPLRRPRPAEVRSDSFDYLDDSKFVSLYAMPGAGRRTMNFYLDGVHCSACVWLTERVGDFVPGVLNTRLNLGDSVAAVSISESGSFAQVAREFARMGYAPHPVRDDEADGLNRAADRLLLARTGVAGACAGNIMLLAISLYAGADGGFARSFRWISFGLVLPVLLFSAMPFYRGAWRAIRSRQASIDLPIALGIGLGAVSSFYNLATGSPYLYFDSLAMLVFLMLASRYLLIRTQRTATRASQLVRFLAPASARVAGERVGTFLDLPVEQIKKGDLIEVFAGECIPVDGVVIEGQSTIDNSLLTGEPKPVGVSPGKPVYAGTINQSGPLRIRATAAGGATRIAMVLSSVQSELAKKAPIATFADRVARYFVLAVLVSVGVVFVFGLRHGLHEAVNLALALSIVTCPCAFALATPLALSLSLGRCAREGILIRGADVLERLTQVDEVFFDKTGTLTTGVYEVLGWDDILQLDTDEQLRSVVVALESRSRHPVAKAILAKFGARVTHLPVASHYGEDLGRGVSGQIDGHLYKVLGWDAEAGTEEGASLYPGAATIIGIWRDGGLLGRIYLGDSLREESARVLRALRLKGFRLGLLSGDSAYVVNHVAYAVGLPRWRAWARMAPADKRSKILKHPRALMVGDGANDAAALAAAYVSVAVHGGVEVSLRSADIYSRRPGISAVPALLQISRETLALIRRNFVISLVYNAAGITGVLLGWVTPLFAAVLMPLSAITVFFSSMAGTAGLRRALAELRK